MLNKIGNKLVSNGPGGVESIHRYWMGSYRDIPVSNGPGGVERCQEDREVFPQGRFLMDLVELKGIERQPLPYRGLCF